MTAAFIALVLAATPDPGTPSAGQPTSPPAGAETPRPPAAEAPAPPAAGGEAKGAGKGGEGAGASKAPDLDFDLFGTPPPAALAVDPEFAKLVERRRTLLTYHQAAGIGTLVTMGATTVLGALNYNQLYGGGGGKRTYVWPHRIGVMVTTVEFAAAGTLAMLAPQPYESDVAGRGFSPGTVHRIATFLATLGMATQIGVGFVTARRAEAGNPHDLRTLARTHEVVGYVTMGLVAVAAGAWVF